MEPPDVLPVILAAGRGTRLHSRLPKVLQDVCGHPMLQYVFEVASACSHQQPIVVCSPEHPEVSALVHRLGGRVVVQHAANGTGGAIRALPDDVLAHEQCVVLSGDVPLLTTETVRKLITHHTESGGAATILTISQRGQTPYGQVLRSLDGRVEGIVEASDREASGNQPALDERVEYNVGTYAFRTKDLIHAAAGLGAENAQKEFYLTDTIAALVPHGVQAVLLDDAREILGVNTQRELAQAKAFMRARLADRLMDAGVMLEDPASTYCDAGVHVGAGTVIQPHTFLRGATQIGERCTIGPMAQLRDVVIGDDSTVGASSIEETSMGNRVSVGQYARIRPGTSIADDVLIGTAAEIKNSSIGAGSFISHFSCVLDATIGEGVNIGAGTVTCNFDGEAKHRTIVGNGTFIGSDSIIIAPRTIGKEAYIGAGSVITRDVADGALAVERASQVHIEGWVAKRHARRSATVPSLPAEQDQ